MMIWEPLALRSFAQAGSGGLMWPSTPGARHGCDAVVLIAQDTVRGILLRKACRAQAQPGEGGKSAV